MRLICVTCKLELRPVKNGVRSIEHSTFGPYKVWLSDRYGCPECGVEVLAGFAEQAVAEHYQPHFSNAASTAEIHFHASARERLKQPYVVEARGNEEGEGDASNPGRDS